MKKLLTLTFLGMLGGMGLSQQATSVPSFPTVDQDWIPSGSMPHFRQEANPALTLPPGHMPLSAVCTGTDALGTSTNMFTIGLTESNPLAYDPGTNSLVFVHRNNASVFGGSSGHFRYDISTNGGFTWTTNQGTLNPLMTYAGRYPNVAIYNPAGNSDPNNAYMTYLAPALNGTAFGYTVAGVRRFNGTGGTENYNPMGITQNYIPRSVVNGAPGVFWAVDYRWSGTAVTGYQVYKGTWTGSDVSWVVNTTFTPTFNTAYNGGVQTSDFQIAFDPTGMIGYVCALTHLTPGPTNYSYYPVFWKTTDGGNTWSGPDQVDISQFACLNAYITVGNYATLAFDMDLTVDKLGNPHCLVPFCNGNNAYAVYFGSTHRMVDITQEHGVWNAIDLANVLAGRGTFGTSPNTMSMDMESQVSRSEDGSKLFFLWSGSDAAMTLGAANSTPNLFGMAYDVNARKWTTMMDFSTCNGTTSGKIYFPKAAETSIPLAGGAWEVPVAYAEFSSGTDPALTANFRYLDSLVFVPADFVNNQCLTAYSLSNTDTITLCQGSSVWLTPSQSFDSYTWSDGSHNDSLLVSTGGTYYLGVRANCCVGYDSIVVEIDSTVIANFSGSSSALTIWLTNLSLGQPLGYLWDFGDGTTSTASNPIHSYATSGTYTVCLIVDDFCGSDTLCQTFTVSCAAPVPSFSNVNSNLTVDFTDLTSSTPAYWSWDFGDGGTSSLQNPSHTYALPGLYTVCLTVGDSCGVDTFCQAINVTCPSPLADFTNNSGSLTVLFQNQSAGTPNGWFWDFGDGNSSTQINPSHTYATPGTYTVCLIITDTCGNDTLCRPVIVTCPAPSAAYNFQTIGNGLVEFTDGTLPTPAGWSWNFGDGGTSSLQNPTHQFTATGLYNVCLTVSNLCGSDTLCQEVNVVVVGMEGTWLSNLQAWPNPTDGTLWIEGLLAHSGDVHVQLVNALGALVSEGNWDLAAGNFRQQMDLSSLANGMYLLTLASGSTQTHIKIVKH